MNKDKLVRNSIVGIFVALYFCVSIISTIHVIDFFSLTNPRWLAISLAVAFEIGAAASLAAIIILDKTNRALVWFLFILLTAMQCMGNMYYAYDNATGFQSWMELFSLNEEEPIYQKRILAIISGAILPVVALGFIKSLVDYVRPSKKEAVKEIEKEVEKKTESETKTVAHEILPVKAMEYPDGSGIKSSMDDIDEEEILREPIKKTETETIQTVKSDNMSNTIESVEELLKEKETETEDTGHNDKRAEAIKQVLDDQSTENIQQIESSNKWPGQNDIRIEPENEGRKFGPPDINNGNVI